MAISQECPLARPISTHLSTKKTIVRGQFSLGCSSTCRLFIYLLSWVSIRGKITDNCQAGRHNRVCVRDREKDRDREGGRLRERESEMIINEKSYNPNTYMVSCDRDNLFECYILFIALPPH